MATKLDRKWVDSNMKNFEIFKEFVDALVSEVERLEGYCSKLEQSLEAARQSQTNEAGETCQ